MAKSNGYGIRLREGSRFVLSVFMILVLFLAGCAGPSDSSKKARAAQGVALGLAAPAEFDEATGGIEGQVVDDGLQPVLAAEVFIVELGLTTRSDVEGRFSFSHLKPAEYILLATNAGHESKRAHVWVSAHQKVSVIIELLPEQSVEFYPVIQQGNGMIGCGIAWRAPSPIDPPTPLPVSPFKGAAAVCGGLAGLPVVGDVVQQYDAFLLDWPLMEKTAAWKSSVFEMKWDAAQALSKGLGMRWEVAGCFNDVPLTFARSEGPSVLNARADESVIQGILTNSTSADSPCEDSSEKCNADHCVLYSRAFSSADTLGANSPVDVGMNLFQSFEQYHTAFFNGPAPKGYSVYNG